MMSGHSVAGPSAAAAASTAIPATSAVASTAPLLGSTHGPPNSPLTPVDPTTVDPTTATLDSHTTAIYELQQQMGQFAARLAAVEHRPVHRRLPMFPFQLATPP